MSEIKHTAAERELLHSAACECMAPRQMDEFESLFDNDDLSARFLRCVMRRYELLEALRVLTMWRQSGGQLTCTTNPDIA